MEHREGQLKVIPVRYKYQPCLCNSYYLHQFFFSSFLAFVFWTLESESILTEMTIQLRANTFPPWLGGLFNSPSSTSYPSSPPYSLSSSTLVDTLGSNIWSQSTSNQADSATKEPDPSPASGSSSSTNGNKIDSPEKDSQASHSDPATSSAKDRDRPRKHIQRACLECRKRHVKCDGVLPICQKCAENNRSCTYIPSQRGGARFSQRKLKSRMQRQEQDQQLQEQLSQQQRLLPHQETQQDPDPSLETVAMESVCTSGCNSDSSIRDDPLIQESSCIFARDGSPSTAEIITLNQNLGVIDTVPNQTLICLILPNEILNTYYTKFHHRHPFLPARAQLELYIDTAPELLAAMGILVQVLLAPKMMTASDLAQPLRKARKALSNSTDDLIKVQASLLLTLISFMSSDTVTSFELRAWCSNICYRALTEASAEEGGYSNVLSSWRTLAIENILYKELLTKAIHEVFFVDVMLSITSRKGFSLFVQSNVIDEVPIEDYPGFAYKCRLRTLKMVHTIVTSLDVFGSGKLTNPCAEFLRLESLVSMFQSLLDQVQQVADVSTPSDPNIPYLVDAYGNVDDGVQQAIMVLNFSAIVLHFPISGLSRTKMPSFLNQSLNFRYCNCPKAQESPLSAGRCIRCATNIICIATMIGKPQITERTPFYACCIAMSLVVHFEIYLSLSQKPDLTDSEEVNRCMYSDHIKLGLEGLQRFSATWGHANKLYASICELMQNGSPSYYMQLVTEGVIEPSAPEELTSGSFDWNDQGQTELFSGFPEKLFDIHNLFS